MNDTAPPPPLRPDLEAAHAAAIVHLAAPGPLLDAATRRAVAEVARDAYLSATPAPPWAPPHPEPELALAYRLARHAATISHGWFSGLGLDPLAALEVVGVVTTVVPLVALARAIGTPVPTLAAPQAGAPTGRVAHPLAEATLNWVPVAAPADQRAAVVQALSALPSEFANLWRLADAQYMSDADMADPRWHRGTLSRAQMELVAGRLSRLRECFY